MCIKSYMIGRCGISTPRLVAKSSHRKEKEINQWFARLLVSRGYGEAILNETMLRSEISTNSPSVYPTSENTLTL